MKQTFLFAVIALLSFNCCSPQFALLEVGENLPGLTKVSNQKNGAEEPVCGVNGRNLFFVSDEYSYVGQNGRWLGRIFFKENALDTSAIQLTTGGDAHSPTYSEYLGVVAFHSFNNANIVSDIYLLDIKTNYITPMIEENDSRSAVFSYLHPCFSPDGKLLAFNRLDRRTWYSELCVKNMETGETKRLGSGVSPRFSPDGKKLVFVHSDQIWTIALDGSNRTKVQMTNAERYALYNNPCWSPDGTKIVFEVFEKNARGGTGAEICIVDVDGGTPVQITKNKSKDEEPYWASDGYIYFSSNRGNKGWQQQIWRFKPTY